MDFRFAKALASVGFCLGIFFVAMLRTSFAKPGWSFDTGLDARAAAKLLLDELGAKPPNGSWLRIRGVTEARLGTEPDINDTREALRRLRLAGYRIVVLVMWSEDSWYAGVREPSYGNRLPVDLREPFERSMRLAATYSDVVDLWEIGNEPDISFVKENAETYTAYLKACYAGIAAGKLQSREHDLIPGSLVLMAGLGLPPGPYFQEFLANDGLTYTAGINYHYYGYAEDFTGVYRQFEAAVASMAGHQRHNTTQSVWQSRMFPSAKGWTSTQVAAFDFGSDDVRAERAALQQRNLAKEEPALVPQGRWLVTPGVKVEEIGDTWRFTVERWPDGPLRAPVAELALPDRWPSRTIGEVAASFPAALRESLVCFEYRKVAINGPTIAATEAMDVKRTDLPAHPATSTLLARQLPATDPAAAIHDQPRIGRELPVFLTEYGYGALDKMNRNTVSGRERQREWFSDVHRQARLLGTDGAMAFQLMPYLERGINEYGLLLNAEAVDLGGTVHRKIGDHFTSPALEELLVDAETPALSRSWQVATSQPNSVVIDFVAQSGLSEAKRYSGYFLEGDAGGEVQGQGQLVLYNFGDTTVTGTLHLTGDAWQLRGGKDVRTVRLVLVPRDRQTVSVVVKPAVAHFVSCDVRAEFELDSTNDESFIADRLAPATSRNTAPPLPSGKVSMGALRPQQSQAAPGSLNMFEWYFRTQNGNLYQTWPRMFPTLGWQSYCQAVENFTMALYGRANLPWRFTDNRPVSVVFFFHPDAFPAVYEVRGPKMVKFSAPPNTKR